MTYKQDFCKVLTLYGAVYSFIFFEMPWPRGLVSVGGGGGGEAEFFHSIEMNFCRVIEKK